MWPFRRRDGLSDEEQRAVTSVPWGPAAGLGRAQVDVERALSLIPVYGCARVLADTIASLPIDIYRRQGDRQEELPAPSLFVQPSIRGTTFDWVHRLVSSLALRGNAYGLITARDYMGFPTLIEWMNPEDVFVADGAQSGPGSYMQPIWYVAGRITPAENIVHIPWFTVPWRVCGLSPIGLFSSTINTGLAAGQYSLDWFDAGGVPSGKFQNTEKIVSKEDADIITSRLTSRIRSRKPLVYGRDWTYEPISITPAEARFVETARLTATQIATIYGVDPTMVGGEVGGSFTYSNTEQLGIKQLIYTFGPWISRLEAALSALFPRGQFVKFNVDALLRTDATTRWGVYKTAIDTGIMDVNEVRALEDLPPKKIEAPAPPQPPAGAVPPPPPGEAPAPAQDQPKPAAQNGNGSSNGKKQVAVARHHLMPPPAWAMPD